jgi:hypothetical protein
MISILTILTAVILVIWMLQLISLFVDATDNRIYTKKEFWSYCIPFYLPIKTFISFYKSLK